MPRIKLTQPGFETYSGQMGVINFTDGLSDSHVRPQDAVRMAATMLCEWEDGTPANVAQSLLDNAHTAATTEVVNELTGSQAMQNEQRAANAVGKSDLPLTRADALPDAPVGDCYTAADLEGIADRDGIKGLRTIAAKHGIKGNSINELIREIVSANTVKE